VSEDAGGSATVDDPAPSEAFGALGGEQRLGILRTLAADGAQSFSTLAAASDADTSAGFAYHLRQVDDRFVRQRDDERYELTDAGRRVVRAMRAGAYTDSVDRDRIDLDADCPFCGAAALVATVVDNVAEIVCEDCERPLLALPFPPGGHDSHDPATFPEAFDAYHRHRIGSFADGVCPDCGGAVTAEIDPVFEAAGGERDVDGEAGGDAIATPEEADAPADHVPVQMAFACDTCGADLQCPVALTVLDHPAVVAFYHDHDRDVRDPPLWRVGAQWRERVLSRDPWCVCVRTSIEDDDLLLYLGRDGTVVDHRRPDTDDEAGEDAVTTTEPADETAAGEPSVDEESTSEGVASGEATA
jgi:hypothetical protein